MSAVSKVRRFVSLKIYEHAHCIATIQTHNIIDSFVRRPASSMVIMTVAVTIAVHDGDMFSLFPVVFPVQGLQIAYVIGTAK